LRYSTKNFQATLNYGGDNFRSPNVFKEQMN